MEGISMTEREKEIFDEMLAALRGVVNWFRHRKGSLFARCDHLPVVIAVRAGYARLQPGLVQCAKQTVEPEFKAPIHAALFYRPREQPFVRLCGRCLRNLHRVVFG
jgi:hypothetical protein